VARAPYGLGAWGLAPATTLQTAAGRSRAAVHIFSLAVLKFRGAPFSFLLVSVPARRRGNSIISRWFRRR
jgi:hypothetical protein